ncbi:MAG: sigma-70 family RNA polymerase sigma factor, partial [Bacteroidota bacterium]
LWEKRETLTPQTNLSGYLYTAVRNRILDFVARQNVQSSYIGSLQTFMDQAENATDHLLRENQLTALIEKEIAALPPKMREVFELSRKAHLSHKEIAEQLGISEKTVKSQVNNALKILRVKLGIFIWIFLLLHF